MIPEVYNEIQDLKNEIKHLKQQLMTKQLNEFTLKVNKSEFKKQRISNQEEAADYIRKFYSDDIEIYESSFILLLNRANDTIGYAKISQGGITGTVIDTKIVLKYCIDSLASAFILCHNHPSGNLKPSKEDIQLTNKIKEAAKLIECDLLDHIILTSEGYYSMMEGGELC